MNKFLAIACLATVATAAPEADADALYSTYGYGLGHYGYGLGAYGYSGYPYAAYHHAPLATGYAHVSPSASLSIAGLANAAVPAVAGGYAGAGRYVANSAGVVHVAKRSAEAEAEAEPEADAFYTTYGYGLPYAGYAGYPYHHAYNYAAYSPYHYGLGYAAYAAPAVAAAEPAEVKTVAAPAVATVAAPFAYHHVAPVATGYAQVNHATSLSTAGLANAAVPAIAGGYAGAGRYVANSAGVVHVA